MELGTETASIEVQRDLRWGTDYLRAYAVVVDGQVTGHVSVGGSCTVAVGPGLHEVFMKIDWCRSESIDAVCIAGETVTLRCGPRANVLTALYWITLGRRRYIELGRLPR